MIFQISVSAQENLSVMDYWKYHRAEPNLIYSQLMSKASAQLEKRKVEVSGLKTQADWSARQRKVSSILQEIVGPFPVKTPLNPVVTGTIERDGIKVEKLYFESVPGFYVTAALFLPTQAKSNLPAIIFCSGHAANGFRSDAYQTMILNYVKKGFAVFAFDPIGQGERIQYFNEDGKNRFGATHEHSYPGTQMFVSGFTPANYFIWDGIRAVDYLLTRKEIDPKRIGITGRSGGGTQSAYIAAFDPRIVAVAPECYITSFDKLLRSNGPQDAEQIFMHGIEKGFDLADLLEVRAPKPALMITTTNDIFSIEGAREVFEEASAAYKAMGKPENMEMVEDDAGHASTLKNREAAYAFFRKHLQLPGDSKDEKVKHFTEEELYATKTGNVYNSIKGENLFSLNQKFAKQNINTKSGQSFPALQKEVLEKSGYQAPKPLAEKIFGGRINRDNYDIEKYLIRSADHKFLPILWTKPRNQSKGTVVLLDEKGKKEAADKGKLADRLTLEGYEVVIPDLNGIGEMANAALPGGDAFIEGVSLNLWFLGVLTKNSLTGLQMQEISMLVDFIKSRGAQKLSLIATGTLCSNALQASMIDQQLFEKKIFLEPLVSFESLVTNQEYRPKYVMGSVAGGMKYYDLPQLVSVQKPQSVLLIGPVTGDGKPLNDTEVKKQYHGSVKSQQVVSSENPQSEEAITSMINFLK